MKKGRLQSSPLTEISCPMKNSPSMDKRKLENIPPTKDSPSIKTKHRSPTSRKNNFIRKTNVDEESSQESDDEATLKKWILHRGNGLLHWGNGFISHSNRYNSYSSKFYYFSHFIIFIQIKGYVESLV